MLKILKGQEDVIKGVVVCEEAGNASSFPLTLHFLSAASTSNQNVVIVSSKFTETNYKLICSKAGVRWIPSQINFMEILPGFSSFDVSAKHLMDEVNKKILESNPSMVLFDDLSILEQFGVSPIEVSIFVHQIYSNLKKNSPDSAFIFAPFSIPSDSTSILKNRCHVFIQMTPVGHGFGKDASSKAVLTIKSPSGPTTKKGILLSGERTINGSWVSVEN